jgi:hypothetical protein
VIDTLDGTQGHDQDHQWEGQVSCFIIQLFVSSWWEDSYMNIFYLLQG